jgi:DNA-3-methyladenine glycosylase II
MQSEHLWGKAEQHLAEVDNHLSQLVSSYGPCTLTPQTEYFIVLCHSIISQQLATKAAATIFGRFSAYYSQEPTPEKVAETPYQTLRDIGLSNQKTGYLYDLSRRVFEGDLDFQHFSALSDEEIIQQLVAVKGIGVWTSQMFLIFALNRPDVLPTEDLGIRRAIMVGYDLAALPTKVELAEIATPWRPWSSVAVWYLWRSLQNK